MLASPDAIREELGLSVADSRRVARFLPEASAYLKTLKGVLWYRAVELLPAILRSAAPPDPPTPPGAPSAVALVVDGPPAGSEVGSPFFVSGRAESDADVVRVEVRQTQGGVVHPWRLVAGTGVVSESAPPRLLAWGVEMTADAGPVVVEVRATAADGATAQTARAYDCAPGPVVADTTGPVVGIDRPTPGGTVEGGVLTVLGRASDPSGVAAVRARVGGGAWTTVWPQPTVPLPDDLPPTDELAASPRPAVAWTYRVYRPAGAVVTVDVEATDTLGNVGVATLAAVILPAPPAPETDGPEIVIDSPRAGATVDQAFTLTGRVSHETALAALDYRVHYAGTAPAAWETLGPVSAGATQAAFAAGVYLGGAAPVIVEVRATAAPVGGAPAAVSTRAVAVAVREVPEPAPDVPAHTLVIDRPTSGATVAGPVVFVVGRASDPGGVSSIETRVSPSTEWEAVTIPAGAPTRVAWAEAFTRPAGASVVEVRATYADGQVRTDAVAVVVTVPEEPTASPPVLTLDRPANAATVTAPAYSVVGRVVASAGRTVTRVRYRYDASDPWEASPAFDVPAGARDVVFGADLPCHGGPSGGAGVYLTLTVRAEDSAGETATVPRVIRVLPATPKTTKTGTPSDHLPGGTTETSDDVPTGHVDRPAEWPTSLGGEPEESEPEPARPAPSAVAPQYGDAVPTAVSVERFRAERAESLLALYYALPLLNLTLAPGGGVLSHTWAATPTGTVETLYASAASLDALRADLLTSAKLLVDGDVRVRYDGTDDNATLSSVEGWAGGGGFLGAI